MNITVRSITEKDHYDVELVAKRAFWNLNMPGCDEHYLVHKLWDAPCYIPELSLAATVNDKLVGAILYSKSRKQRAEARISVSDEVGNTDIVLPDPDSAVFAL